MFCTNCGKRLIEGQYACPDCGTRRAAMAGKTAHVIRITRARLAVIIAASVIVSLLAGSLVTWGVARGTGVGGSTAITGLASVQTPPSIDGTWVSQGELDRPFTLNNGVITTSDIEDGPGKGTYTISDKPDDNGYYVLDLRFDEMNECTSDTADTLESCKGRSFDITRFEIRPDKESDNGYISSFALRPVLSKKQQRKVSKGRYYDNCAWSLGYMWYNGGNLGDCALDPSTFEPVKPDYWTMIHQ